MLATADAVADGAAKMTSTTVSRKILGVAATQHFNRPMAEAAQANIVAVGLPKWDADDQAFARAVQANVGATVTTGLPTKLAAFRSEEHTSELQSLMRSSYAVFCWKKKSTHVTY